MQEKKLIALLKNGDAQAQRSLYQKYKIVLFTICLRYSRDRAEAEDIMQEGFIRIFKDIRQYNYKGSFEGWLKRVMVNSALQYLRKWKREMKYTDSSDYNALISEKEVAYSRLALADLTRFIQQLPVGYRTIFNLYVIEGYSHKEIAQMLDINENTSKSQLSKAKAKLRKKLEAHLIP